MAFLVSDPANADGAPVRVAFFHTELTRDGPGLMLRDIERGEDDQTMAVRNVIRTVQPDILVMWGIDWDLELRGLSALQEALVTDGAPYPHSFSRAPNRAIPTGLDLNGNSSPHDPEDAQSFGTFTGENGMAILSRFPIAAVDVKDFTAMLWRDLPDALLPWPGMPKGAENVLRLSSTNHWLVPIDTKTQGRVWIGAFAAVTPVFDGPEDRNGRRNHDELMFWHSLLDGNLTETAPPGLVLVGHANLDPDRGDGRRVAIRQLLDHPHLQDARPTSTENGTLTVDWSRDDLENMRLSYVLPSRDWDIVDAGVHWPAQNSTAQTASRHKLVWVDIKRPN